MISKKLIMTSAFAVSVFVLLFSFQNCSNQLKVDSSSSNQTATLNTKKSISRNLDIGTICSYKNYGSGCPDGWICPAEPLLPATTQIGAWYSLYFYDQSHVSSDFFHWNMWTRYAPLLSKFGPTKSDGSRDFYGYDAGDVIQQQYACFKKAGLSYLVLDNTNFIGNDSGKIEENVRKVFANLNSDISIAMALGAPLWSDDKVNGVELKGNKSLRKALMDSEASTVFNDYSKKQNYKKWENGKPLLVIYNDIENTYANDDHIEFWNDSRFAVKESAHQLLGKTAKLQNYKNSGVWGWAVFDPLESSETMTVQPGYYTRHMQGRENHPFVLKNNGANYMKHWLLVLKNKPRNVVIPSWNDWAEETAIEPAYARLPSAEKSLDAYGVEVPDWYLQITEAYTNLRIGFMEENFYKMESKNEVYKVVRGKFELQNEMPHEKPVIVVPDGSITVAPVENKQSWRVENFGSCTAAPVYSYGGWSTCTNGSQTRSATCINTAGTQSRTISCINEKGAVVADSNCTTSKPELMQSCYLTCSGAAVTTQNCSSGNPSILSGTYKFNDQVLYADGTNYCVFSSLISYYDISGASSTTGLQSISSRPTNLNQKPDCFKIQSGIFKIGFDLYYSNGSHFCYFPTMEIYTARTGRTEANGVPSYTELPIVMKNDGSCK